MRAAPPGADASSSAAAGRVVPLLNRRGAQGEIGAALPVGHTVEVNAHTTLRADATGRGNGGEIVLWSGEKTLYEGSLSARGGLAGGSGGRAEVSSGNGLSYRGRADLSAPDGAGGLLLLDPKNIIVADIGPVGVELLDPNLPRSGIRHGSGGVTELSSGNIVVASPLDNFGASDTGAVYLYSGQTGALLASLRGTSANDQVGSGGVTALTNGNYLVASPFWRNGAVANAGAVTWGSGARGVNGVVSAANSLVGSTPGDLVGRGGVTALTNGNYVVKSTQWDNGAVVNAGAATWGSGTSGITGPVSAANSLVGTAQDDQVGGFVTALTNGNYVVMSTLWANGAASAAGAVTWSSGTSGIAGPVSAGNSLVGTAQNDQVGTATALTNGNYVVTSPFWANSGPNTGVGAVTWGSGASGITGAVSAANSLVGSTVNDLVGFAGVTTLANGNYVVNSPRWYNGALANAGAVTWGLGTSGITGVVSAANSLVGSSGNDSVGSVTALTNGNYVVWSPTWSNGSLARAGAVTWGSGTTGLAGAVSVANSLVGSQANDQVGAMGVTALTNGNYVVRSPDWANGTAARAGAVTWVSGTSAFLRHCQCSEQPGRHHCARPRGQRRCDRAHQRQLRGGKPLVGQRRAGERRSRDVGPGDQWPRRRSKRRQ